MKIHSTNRLKLCYSLFHCHSISSAQAEERILMLYKKYASFDSRNDFNGALFTDAEPLICVWTKKKKKTWKNAWLAVICFGWDSIDDTDAFQMFKVPRSKMPWLDLIYLFSDTQEKESSHLCTDPISGRRLVFSPN